MMPVERRILIKAASMYYLDHLKQSEIAARMGVDRTTVSKYLKKAMKSGIVKIEVESDSYEELEAALERRFGLREAYVVPKSYDMLAIKQSMAQAGLNLLRRIMADGQVVGMAWGSTIQELTKYAHHEKMPQLDIDFVPIDGGPESIDSDHHVNTICYEMAKTAAAVITSTHRPLRARRRSAMPSYRMRIMRRSRSYGSALTLRLSVSVHRSSRRISSGRATLAGMLSIPCGALGPWGRFAPSSTTRMEVPCRRPLRIARLPYRSIPCAACRTALAWQLHVRKCQQSWGPCAAISSMC